MFLSRGKKENPGFTLVELAIVLAVTGVLFVGLYRLLSGGNAQLKDSSTASQQIQLIDAVKAFLNTSQGQQWMANAIGANGTSNVAATNIPGGLPLPTSTSPCTFAPPNNADPNLPTFCNSLPSGFTSGTTNAYGQTYGIQVQTGPVTAPSTVPSYYSFMIATNNNANSDIIPDADGGRISAQIGGDGGFIYQVNPCGFQACGSYGAWQANLVGGIPAYGFGASPGNGHVVSRTYVSSESLANDDWLARQSHLPGIPVPGGTSPKYATMLWPLFLGGQNLFMNSNTTVTQPQSPTPLNSIFLQGAPIVDQAIDPVNNTTMLSLGVQANGFPNTNYISNAPLVLVSTNCTIDQTTANTLDNNNINGGGIGIEWISPDAVTNGIIDNSGHLTYTNHCKPALQVVGDGNILGLLQATSLFSGTFIYQASDARLKIDIRPVAHGLDAVMQMKPVSYTLKAGGQKSLGFVAQDMEKIYPELVLNAGDSKGVKAINYEGLVAPLVAAVQELKQQNDDLRHQLHEQELRQQALEQKLQLKQP